MSFSEVLSVTENWNSNSVSKFSVFLKDEVAHKIVVQIPDTDVNFHITLDEESKKCMIWSENDEVISCFRDIDNITEISVAELAQVLQACGDCLLKLNKGTDPQGSIGNEELEVEEEEEEEQDIADYYYDDPASDVEQNDEKLQENESDDSEEENLFNAEGSSSALHRLYKDYKSLSKGGEQFCVQGIPRKDNFFLWDVKLTNFPSDTKLGKDLQKYAGDNKSKNREPVIYMEMHFPSDYPMKPPFVRIVRPRFKFLTGHVTIGGSICMQMLTNSGWTPTNDIENILVQIRSEIMSDANAQLDSHNADQAYTEQEAKDAFTRMVKRYGW